MTLSGMSPLQAYRETQPGCLPSRPAARASRTFSPRRHIRMPVSRRVVHLVLFVLVCSAFDALFTLLHIQRGGSEANPLMALAMQFGTLPFLGIKMGLTGLGAVILASCERTQLGLKSLYSLAMVYTGLLGYHGVIIWSGF